MDLLDPKTGSLHEKMHRGRKDMREPKSA